MIQKTTFTISGPYKTSKILKFPGLQTTLKDNYIFCWNKEKSCTPVCEVAIANSEFPAF